MGIIQQLEKKTGFTDTEVTIADFILAHPDLIRDLSIKDLAQVTYSSNAAIIRMCRKLGLEGYREFRIAFAADLEKTYRIEKGQDVDRPIDREDSTASIMRSIANISQNAVEECYTYLSPGRIAYAAKLIRKARRVYIYAAGETLLNAKLFANLLLKIGIVTIFPAENLESAPITAGSGKEDVALIVSYTGFILDSMKQEFDLFRRNHTPVIAISMRQDVDVSIHLIQIPDREKSVGKVAGFYSQSAIAYSLNCLYAAVYSLDLETYKAIKDDTDSHAYNEELND